MTDKVHPSFNREAARSRETSTAIAYAGAAGDGWVWPSSSRLVEDSEGDLATGALNAFDETSSASSLSVTIDTGEAARRGAYLARDTTTNLTLPASSTTTISLGWKDGQADTILIGEVGTGVGDTFTSDDPRSAIWTFDTDGTGVTSVTDERRLADNYRIPADAVEDLGVEVQDDGTTVVDPATVIDFGDSDFDVTNPTAGEAQVGIGSTAIDTGELVDAAVTAAKLANDSVDTAAIVNDAVTQAKIAADAVGSTQIAAGAVDTTQIASNAVTAAKIAAGAVGTTQLDLSISPTWTGDHIFQPNTGNGEIRLRSGDSSSWASFTLEDESNASQGAFWFQGSSDVIGLYDYGWGQNVFEWQPSGRTKSRVPHEHEDVVGIRGSNSDNFNDSLGSTDGELMRGATSESDVIFGGDAGTNSHGWVGYNVAWSDVENDWVVIDNTEPCLVLWFVTSAGASGPGVELGASPASNQSADGEVITFTGSFKLDATNGNWRDAESGVLVWDSVQNHIPYERVEDGERIVASGTATLSSGSATVSTGITTTGTHFDVRLDPSGGGANTADVKASARAFWDNSAGEYKVEILEDGTSVGNPDIGYEVLAS